MIDPAKLDPDWAKDERFYIEPGGRGGIGTRYRDFGRWLRKGLPIEPSEAYIHERDGIRIVAFGNGRHRFAWLRDNHQGPIEVSFLKEQAEQARELYGSDASVKPHMRGEDPVTTCSPEMRRFGKKLAAFLQTDEALRIIVGFCADDMGWTTGVCRILAEGIARWLGPDASLWSISGYFRGEHPKYGRMYHVLIKIDGCFLDGEGAKTRGEVLARWRAEGLEDPKLKKFQRGKAEGILSHPTTSRQIARALEARFGPGRVG